MAGNMFTEVIYWLIQSQMVRMLKVELTRAKKRKKKKRRGVRRRRTRMGTCHRLQKRSSRMVTCCRPHSPLTSVCRRCSWRELWLLGWTGVPRPPLCPRWASLTLLSKRRSHPWPWLPNGPCEWMTTSCRRLRCMTLALQSTPCVWTTTSPWRWSRRMQRSPKGKQYVLVSIMTSTGRTKGLQHNLKSLVRVYSGVLSFSFYRQPTPSDIPTPVNSIMENLQTKGEPEADLLFCVRCIM